MKKVAIVGVEGSGKTVMLAGLGELYSRPDDEGYFLSPKNYATASYVAEKIERMRKGEWPVATAEDVMQGLDWTLKRRQGERQRPEDVCEVSCLDFAGEIYRLAFGIRQGPVPNGLADEVSALKKYIKDADDLIVLINLRDVIAQGAREPRVQWSMWVTNESLSYALDETGGRKTPRAAIVLSQADSYAETIKTCQGPQGVLEKYLPHVANNYSWLDILAVSAVDKTILDDNGNEVPSPDFQSEELRAIMGWILVGFKGGEAKSTVGQAPLSLPRQPSPSPSASANPDNERTKGRVGRREFWNAAHRHLLLLLVANFLYVVPIVSTLHGHPLSSYPGGAVSVGVGIFLIIYSLISLTPITTRRLHDQNVSGWGLAILWFFGFVPYLGLIVELIFFLRTGSIPGTIGMNDYGKSPEEGKRVR